MICHISDGIGDGNSNKINNPKRIRPIRQSSSCYFFLLKFKIKAWQQMMAAFNLNVLKSI